MDRRNNNSYSHGVNQAGRAQPVDPYAKKRAAEPNPLVAGLYTVLNAFGNLISPIKEEEKKRK